MSSDPTCLDNSNFPKLTLDLKIIEYFPCGVSVATDETCSNIIHNPSAAKFLRLEPLRGLSLLNWEDPPFSAFLNGELLPPERMPIWRAARNGEYIRELRLEFCWPDGVRKVARVSAGPIRDEYGVICGAVSMLEDITGDGRSVQSAEAEPSAPGKSFLQNYDDAVLLFNMAFDVTPAMKMIIRAKDLTYLAVNQALLRFYRVEKEKILGKHLQDFQTDPAFIQAVSDIMGTQDYIDEMEISTANDNRTYLTSARTLWIGQEKCYFISMFDISQMNIMKSEMVRLEGLNALGKMAAAVGHEVRNPMSTVRGYLQLLELKPEYSMDRSRLDIMISELDRANSLLTEFLSLVRNKPMDLLLKNINDIVSRLSPLLETDAVAQKKQIRFRLNEVPDIFLNEQEIAQLLINLCRNGLEAMEENGILTVTTWVENDMVMMAVQDQGRGIPNEVREKIGTPFFTTKERGTGLGLSICYNIVKRHNGYIKIESSSAGSIFTACFPIRS